MTTDITEFERFHIALTSDRHDYVPHYLLLNKNEKDPAPKIPWKDKPLSFEDAKHKMADGYNIGIAATTDDILVIIDVDNPEAFSDHNFKPTLTAKSSSRRGTHYFYVTSDPRTKITVPLSAAGELRSAWSYVVAPGSYAPLVDSVEKGIVVKTKEDKLSEIDESDRHNAGKYTVVNAIKPSPIRYEELPKLFTDAKDIREKDDEHIIIENVKRQIDRTITIDDKSKSALYTIKMEDIFNIPNKDRFQSLFHDSHTGKNTSFSQGLIHCWRHNVSHNAITSLAVMAGIYDCVDAGYGHRHGGAGESRVDRYDGRTMFQIWDFAKKNGFIPKDDNPPGVVLKWYALNNDMCIESEIEDGWKLPDDVYKSAIKTLTGKDIKPKNKKSETINNAAKLFKTPDLMDIANELQTQSPIFYDRKRVLWIWVYDHYEIIDDTDIQNALMGLVDHENKVLGKGKSAILDAVKISGRRRSVNDKPKKWIQLADCIYDIETKKIFDASPEYHFTNPIPHSIGSSTETPTIDKLFVDWVGKEKKDLLYQICAYCLIDDYPIHRLFLLFGKGRNGKGQFRDILIRLVGRENMATTTIEGLIRNRFESARLYKKKIATIGETNFKLLEDTSIIKMLTGGDPIPAEFKNKEPFDFSNTAKIIINTNSLPPTTDKTDAFYSRVIIIKFENQFHKCKDIIDSIPDYEYDNLVAKCLEIIPSMLDNGGFDNEGSIEEKSVEYEALSNPLIEFIRDMCDTSDINAITPLWHIEEDFNEYVSIKGLRKYENKEVRKLLENNGYELKTNHRFKEFTKNGQWTGVLGVRLKNNVRVLKNKEQNDISLQQNADSPFQKSIGILYSSSPTAINQEQEKEKLDNLDKLDNSHSIPYIEKMSTTQPTSPTSPTGQNLDKEIDSVVSEKMCDFCLTVKNEKDIVKGPPGTRWICLECQQKLKADFEYWRVNILKDDRTIVGVDGNHYVMKAGTSAFMPRTNAEALINRGVASRKTGF